MEALIYQKLADEKVKCHVCSHHCLISPGKTGICGVRKNVAGKLLVLNYPLAIATSIDPIEKKPLYEYLPSSFTYSFAARGCNFHCPWCQNFTISQVNESKNVREVEISPAKHVDNAIKYNCPSISYTYSEPTIFIEYALETMKIARKKGLKNIWVSNGYMSQQALDLILPYLDAANIDYKGNEALYKGQCGGKALIVLKNMKTMKEAGVHLEVTTLLIPDLNSDPASVKEIALSLIEYLGKDFIWHITRFFPNYRMLDREPTRKSDLYQAKKIGNDLGIKNIYLGNI